MERSCSNIAGPVEIAISTRPQDSGYIPSERRCLPRSKGHKAIERGLWPSDTHFLVITVAHPGYGFAHFEHTVVAHGTNLLSSSKRAVQHWATEHG